MVNLDNTSKEARRKDLKEPVEPDDQLAEVLKEEEPDVASQSEKIEKEKKGSLDFSSKETKEEPLKMAPVSEQDKLEQSIAEKSGEPQPAAVKPDNLASLVTPQKGTPVDRLIQMIKKGGDPHHLSEEAGKEHKRQAA